MSLTKASFSMITGAPANVLDFGADPTGVADCSAAFTAALAANNNVFVPLGTYKINTTITLLSGQTLQGVGNTSIIKTSGAINGISIGNGAAGTGGLTYAGAWQGALRNIKIKAGDTIARTGIYGRGARNWVFDNVEIEGFAYNTGGATIQGFTVAGIQLDESWACYFNDLFIQYSASHGLFIPSGQYANDLKLTNCYIAHNAGSGIQDYGGAGRTYNVLCEDNATGGIFLQGVQAANISGGYFESNLDADITVGINTSGINITGNYFIGASENAHKTIWLSDCNYIVFSANNIAYGAGTTGNYVVYVQNSNTSVLTIENNSVVKLVGTETYSYTNSSSAWAAYFTNNIQLNASSAGQSGTKFQFNSGDITDANVRNWHMASNVNAYGDFAIQVSATKGTTPSISKLQWDVGSAGLYFGTGAPSAAIGTSGDAYINAAGGTGSTIYQKRSGSWVAIL